MRIGGRSSLGHIGPLAGDPHNRVRANAVRALLRLGHGDAPAALHRMLRDERPLHRVSGIWAARAARAACAAGDLMRLAERDRRPESRSRALAALRMLEGRGDPVISQKASIEA